MFCFLLTIGEKARIVKSREGREGRRKSGLAAGYGKGFRRQGASDEYFIMLSLKCSFTIDVRPNE